MRSKASPLERGCGLSLAGLLLAGVSSVALAQPALDPVPGHRMWAHDFVAGLACGDLSGAADPVTFRVRSGRDMDRAGRAVGSLGGELSYSYRLPGDARLGGGHDTQVSAMPPADAAAEKAFHAGMERLRLDGVIDGYETDPCRQWLGEPIKLQVGGYYQAFYVLRARVDDGPEGTYVGFADPAPDPPAGPNEEIWFGGETILDNGLTIGGTVQLEDFHDSYDARLLDTEFFFLPTITLDNGIRIGANIQLEHIEPTPSTSGVEYYTPRFSGAQFSAPFIPKDASGQSGVTFGDIVVADGWNQATIPLRLSSQGTIPDLSLGGFNPDSWSRRDQMGPNFSKIGGSGAVKFTASIGYTYQPLQTAGAARGGPQVAAADPGAGAGQKLTEGEKRLPNMGTVSALPNVAVPTPTVSDAQSAVKLAKHRWELKAEEFANTPEGQALLVESHEAKRARSANPDDVAAHESWGAATAAWFTALDEYAEDELLANREAREGLREAEEGLARQRREDRAIQRDLLTFGSIFAPTPPEVQAEDTATGAQSPTVSASRVAFNTTEPVTFGVQSGANLARAVDTVNSLEGTVTYTFRTPFNLTLGLEYDTQVSAQPPPDPAAEKAFHIGLENLQRMDIIGGYQMDFCREWLPQPGAMSDWADKSGSVGIRGYSLRLTEN